MAFGQIHPLEATLSRMAELETALQEHKRLRQIRGEVMIESLPPALIDACRELPPHLCEVVDDYINLTGDTAAAGVLVRNISEYRQWKLEHGFSDEHRALTFKG